jgi:hypothetical protein
MGIAFGTAVAVNDAGVSEGKGDGDELADATEPGWLAAPRYHGRTTAVRARTAARPTNAGTKRAGRLRRSRSEPMTR